MGRYTTIPQDAFEGLQLDAGMLLDRFDIAAAAAGELGFTDEDIICATTGGINPTCVATYSDFAEDVDNAPINLMEFKHLDSWDCGIATTSLGMSPKLIKWALGAADIDKTNTGLIIPRRALKLTDFSDLWWVGDRADGGFVAINLKNALSSGGLSLQTTKNGKGQITLEIKGHVSLKAQDEVPMQFYSIDPAEAVTYTVSFDVDGGSAIEDQTVESGATATRPENPTKTGYLFDDWYTSSAKTTKYDFATPVTVDTVIYAKWVNAYTVSFDTDGGTEIENQTVASGGLATQPEDPTKDGYTFGGWYDSDSLTTEFDFDTPITEDTVIYAKWS